MENEYRLLTYNDHGRKFTIVNCVMDNGKALGVDYLTNPIGENKTDLRKRLKEMQDALNKPILDLDNNLEEWQEKSS